MEKLRYDLYYIKHLSVFFDLTIVFGMLTTSITIYFSMLDLGYGGALGRFVAQHRARRDARALNEVLSTLSVVYASIGA